MGEDKFSYRLGLDVGVRSIGWSVLRLDERQGIVKVADAGVRVFSDGRADKSKATLALNRRLHRSARRRRDRFLQRRQYLINALTKAGLFPYDQMRRLSLQQVNPLELRGRALTEKLTPFEIGRALFHINQRRGFKSNRKDKQTQSGVVAGSIRLLAREMGLLDEGEMLTADSAVWMARLRQNPALSLGTFLWRRQQQNQPTRARPVHGEDGTLLDVYPSREMYIDEFHKLWDAQAAHHPALLSPAAKEKLFGIIFSQRRIKRASLGRCMYMTGKTRAPRAMPSVQRYRIYQQVNALEWRDAANQPRQISDNKAARDAIVEMLEKPSGKKAEVSFKAIKKELARRNLIADAGAVVFSEEEGFRRGLDVNQTSACMQQPEFVGARWHEWSLDVQDDFVAIILNDELDDEEVHQRLQDEFGLSAQQAMRCADAYLPDGEAGIFLQAARLMLEKMKDGVPAGCGEIIIPIQRKAAEIVAAEREDFIIPMPARGGQAQAFAPLPQLPYYGEVFGDGRHIIPGRREERDRDDELKYFGGVANPTVHIALNQVRKVVNELIARYGHPASLAMQVSSELPEGEQYRATLAKERRRRLEKAQALAAELAAMGQEDSAENRLRLQLWREQQQRCPYSGDDITAGALFGAAVAVDHIIPFAISLDDSADNKVLCTAQAKRDKGERAPWQAFADNPEGYRWDDILKRAGEIAVATRVYSRGKGLWLDLKLNSKQWRFTRAALKKLQAGHDDMLAPHLNDPRYIGRLTKEYLENICRRDDIDVLSGKLTPLLRRQWQLDTVLSPDECGGGADDDYRDHAIGAVVVGMTDKTMLQKIAAANHAAGDDMAPWQGFRAEVRKVIGQVSVSHRINHKKQGQLHEESAYGIVNKKERELLSQDRQARKTTVVFRKGIDAFTDKKHVNEIRDLTLRRAFLQRFDAAVAAGQKGADGVLALAREKNIRRLRVTVQKTVQPILDKERKVYKAYGLGNHNSKWAVEIYQLPSAGEWQGVVISKYDAMKDSFQPGVTHRPHPAARLVMRLFNNDMLHITTEDGLQRLMRVHKMSQGGIYICEHHLANVASRLKMLVDAGLCHQCSATRLQKFKAVKVHVSPTGRVRPAASKTNAIKMPKDTLGAGHSLDNLHVDTPDYIIQASTNQTSPNSTPPPPPPHEENKIIYDYQYIIRKKSEKDLPR